jgi:superfamily II DNA or RNA helicase
MARRGGSAVINLFDWQTPAVAQQDAALLKYGSAINASETGTGKTYMALDTCRRFGWRPAILCPKVAIAGWTRSCKAMGVEPYFIDTYEKAVRGGTDWITRVGKKAYRWHLPDDTLTIFDEVHKTKSYQSLNCAMHLSHTAQGYASLNLSATVAENPLQMKAIGAALKLFHPRDFLDWMMTNGVTPCYFGGYEFKPKNAPLYLPALHAQLFPERGCRIRTKDVPSFPETQIIAECHDVSGRKLSQELDALVRTYMAQAEAVLTDQKTMLEFGLRMRQATEPAKLELLLELHDEYRENGMSVLIFVNFDHSIEWLRKHVKNASFVHGGQSKTERENEIAKFQRNETRTCICNTDAGGTGVDLDDTDGNFPRASLICPNYNCVSLKQVLGRPHRAGTKSKSLQRIIYAAGTVEEEICAAVSAKLDNLDLLNDGDIMNAIFKNP